MSFVSSQWKQKESLGSEVKHITTSYIPLGRTSPMAPFGSKWSWAKASLAGQAPLSDNTTLWEGENELMVDKQQCWPQQPWAQKGEAIYPRACHSQMVWLSLQFKKWPSPSRLLALTYDPKHWGQKVTFLDLALRCWRNFLSESCSPYKQRFICPVPGANTDQVFELKGQERNVLGFCHEWREEANRCRGQDAKAEEEVCFHPQQPANNNNNDDNWQWFSIFCRPGTEPSAL